MVKSSSAFIFITLLLFCNCSHSQIVFIKKHPLKQIKNYKVNFKVAPEQRIFAAPDVVIKTWMKWDKRDDYKIYIPSPKDRERLAVVMKSLPPVHYRVLKNKLIGIYFIENVLGSGIADWVMGPQNEKYYYIVLNPNNLKNNLSEQLTWRASTAVKKNSGSLKVKIKCDERFSGLHYILFHEVTHIVDYEKQFSPFVEPGVKHIQKGGDGTYAFTYNAWKSRKKSKILFPYQKGIRFYGLGGKPVLKSSDLVKVYQALEKTPFTSLYGAMNWAEDLADFVTFYHITQKYKSNYSIEIFDGKNKVYSYEPMKNPLVRKRFKYMKFFYK